MVRVVHAAPFEVGPATASAVIGPILGEGGSLPLLGVNYRTVSPYLAIPAGGYNFKLYPGPTLTGTVALDTNLFFADGAKLTVVAIGTNTDAYPLALVVLNDQQEAAPMGQASVRIFHAAPFGATAEQTGVDVVAQDGSAIDPPVNGLFYGENTGYVNLPSGVPIDLKVVPTGLPAPTLIDIPVLTLGPSGAFTAIAKAHHRKRSGRGRTWFSLRPCGRKRVNARSLPHHLPQGTSHADRSARTRSDHDPGMDQGRGRYGARTGARVEAGQSGGARTCLSAR
ncbi:MAG: DUF4397 domain-containing protein [Oscillochloridaceae bacterium umkhey_bin13]